MKKLMLFDPSADAELSKLENSTKHPEAYERINDVLDAIEDNPRNHHLRQHRYQNPPIFGTSVRTRTNDWLILWSTRTDEEHQETVITVHYIGPDLL